jgi:hypothetical protein
MRGLLLSLITLKPRSDLELLRIRYILLKIKFKKLMKNGKLINREKIKLIDELFL